MLHKIGKVDCIAVLRTAVLGLVGLVFLAVTAEAEIYGVKEAPTPVEFCPY